MSKSSIEEKIEYLKKEIERSNIKICFYLGLSIIFFALSHTNFMDNMFLSAGLLFSGVLICLYMTGFYVIRNVNNRSLLKTIKDIKSFHEKR